MNKDDLHWKAESPDTLLAVWLYQPGSDERNVQLKERLRIEDAVTEQQKTELLSVLLKLGEAFALNNDELGKTSVVEHSIDTKDAPPVSTSVRRILYALRGELEKELENLEDRMYRKVE